MPAYAVPFFTRCQWQYCTKTAQEEVYDTGNGYRGRYCPVHARRMVRELNALCHEDESGEAAKETTR